MTHVPARAETHGIHSDPVLHHPHRPIPEPDGRLVADPEILLKAKGFDLQIEFFYNSRSDSDGPYGKGRSISPACHILSSTSDAVAGAVRGNERLFAFEAAGTSGATTSYDADPGMNSGTSLVYDSGIGAFVETFADGKKIVYGENLGGAGQVKFGVSRIEDPSGNRHTYRTGPAPRRGSSRPSRRRADARSPSTTSRAEEPPPCCRASRTGRTAAGRSNTTPTGG